MPLSDRFLLGIAQSMSMTRKPRKRSTGSQSEYLLSCTHVFILSKLLPLRAAAKTGVMRKGLYADKCWMRRNPMDAHKFSSLAVSIAAFLYTSLVIHNRRSLTMRPSAPRKLAWADSVCSDDMLPNLHSRRIFWAFLTQCSLTEPVKAARPDVNLVLVKSDVDPLSCKRNHVKLKVDVLAQTVRAAEGACGVGARHVARVHSLGEGGGGDEGERRLSLDTSAEVNEPTEQLASKFDLEVDAVKSVGQHICLVVGRVWQWRNLLWLQRDGGALGDIEVRLVVCLPSLGVYHERCQPL